MKISTIVRFVIVPIIISLLATSCRGSQAQETVTIGVINYVSVLDPVVEGFKAGMADLGYVEGENVTYIYNGIVEPNPEVIDTEIENLLAQDIDLLFTVGSLPAIRAKEVVEGTDIPVVFDAITNPVQAGIVESISHPGGNLTGVQINPQQFPKALEWLVTIVPETPKVYMPYNPNDAASLVHLSTVDNAASQLGIELVHDEVFSVEEAVAAIESLSEDIDAIFRIPSPTLDPRNNELSQAAITRGLPMGATVPMDEAVLITLGADFWGMGKQGGRLVHQVLQGIKPADLPVETGEYLLVINLRTAEAIGIDISDDTLDQADTVIR